MIVASRPRNINAPRAISFRILFWVLLVFSWRFMGVWCRGRKVILGCLLERV